MTESDILRIWNGPTSVCNKAKILQFAADIESRLRAESAQEPVAEVLYAGILDAEQRRLQFVAVKETLPDHMKLYAAPVAKPAEKEMVMVPREPAGYDDAIKEIAIRVHATMRDDYSSDSVSSRQWSIEYAHRLVPQINAAMSTQLDKAKKVLIALDKTYAAAWERDKNAPPGYVSGNVNTNTVGELMSIVRAMLAASGPKT